MNFDELLEFRKDLKRLQKKFRTLADDLKVVRQVLEKGAALSLADYSTEAFSLYMPFQLR